MALVPFQLVGSRCQGINFEPHKMCGEAGERTRDAEAAFYLP